MFRNKNELSTDKMTWPVAVAVAALSAAPFVWAATVPGPPILFPTLERVEVDFPNWKVSFVPGDRVLKSIYVDAQIAPALRSALDCIKAAELSTGKTLLKTFEGSYVHRKIRGQDRWSYHAYGRALDINMTLGQDPEVVQCFKSNGFRWGGDWEHRPDPMHFEWRGN